MLIFGLLTAGSVSQLLISVYITKLFKTLFYFSRIIFYGVFQDYCHSHDPWGRAEGRVIDERMTCPPKGLAKCPLNIGVHKNGKDEAEKCLGCGACNEALSKVRRIVED